MTAQPERDQAMEEVWRTYLTHGELASCEMMSPLTYRNFKRLMRVLPTGPRCTGCHAPFGGIGASVVRRVLGITRSRMNPQWCNICEQYLEKNPGGVEIELSMLFADMRGSTSLAEGMSPAQYSQVINRFYTVTSDLMVQSNALLQQLVGDEVIGHFVPGIAGPAHARVAVETARAMLRATGHNTPQGPWVPLGVGVHTGTAFVGAVGSQNGVSTITALGDAVNTTARLASQAAPGEILVSEATCRAASLRTTELESRHLQLKGRSEPVLVRVVRV